MKREIKFRVWDINKKLFIPNYCFAILNRTEFGAFGKMIMDWENYKEGEFFYDNAQELVEFTGLKDKNGKEIYEGDILESDNPNFGYGDPSQPDTLYFKIDSLLDFYDDEYLKVRCNSSEVIGNIYENPELL